MSSSQYKKCSKKTSQIDDSFKKNSSDQDVYYNQNNNKQLSQINDNQQDQQTKNLDIQIPESYCSFDMEIILQENIKHEKQNQNSNNYQYKAGAQNRRQLFQQNLNATSVITQQLGYSKTLYLSKSFMEKSNAKMAFVSINNEKKYGDGKKVSQILVFTKIVRFIKKMKEFSSSILLRETKELYMKFINDLSFHSQKDNDSKFHESTVGFGDITPENEIEKIVCILITIVSCGVFAYSVSIVGQIFRDQQQYSTQLRKTKYEVAQYMIQRNIGKTTQYKVLKELEYQNEQSQHYLLEGYNHLQKIQSNVKDLVFQEYFGKILEVSKFIKLGGFSSELVTKLSLKLQETIYICKSIVHSSQECPFVHYPIHKFQIIGKYQWSQPNQRKKQQRISWSVFNALSDKQKYREQLLKIRTDYVNALSQYSYDYVFQQDDIDFYFDMPVLQEEEGEIFIVNDFDYMDSYLQNQNSDTYENIFDEEQNFSNENERDNRKKGKDTLARKSEIVNIKKKQFKRLNLKRVFKQKLGFQTLLKNK
ncbi:hypothetical protein PPERSA_10022 [Pseudocohnilembus persalinus]|uniref:Potassium channel domain-containing protein n=1 Tax=Pseudocohnilembus persalinus TaxID=266149 RepID=A0A0V0QK77_PSEPJ|nr:hypothetical protein PPERSA_10022 [Pseudocohnilembus persalinus]|eukprot:KRX02405.1 hypothetical protein PPERSA_10022 [Pseudocohnilembus persalinus]